MPRLAVIRPKFRTPPLAEQAVTVCFEPIQGFDLCDFGLFWGKIRDEFPTSETAQRIETPVEVFGDQIEFSTGISLAPLMLPRAFYRSEVGDLVQLQNDRFTFNWVKSEGRDYPHFDETYQHFSRLFGRFAEYVEERGLAVLNIMQAEITNLNLISSDNFGGDFSRIGEIFNVDPLDMNSAFLINETYTRTRQHRIVDDRGAPIGRLHTVMNPVFNPFLGEKAYKFELTARSAQNLRSLDDVGEFCADARSAINAAFLATVREEMRKKWGEKND